MATDSFVIRCLHSARRGMGGVLFLALEGVVRLFLTGCVVMGVTWVAGAAFATPLPNRDVALSAACFWAFGATAWCFFASTCRLAWWRSFEQAGDGAISRGAWIRDLPAVMAIDALSGIGRTLATVGVALSLSAIVLRHSLAAVPALAFSLLALAAIGYLQPAVTAERLVHGPGIARAIGRAFATFSRHPLRALAVCAIPTMASAACVGLGVILTIFGRPGYGALSMTLAVAVDMARPVFWCELSRLTP